MSDDLMGRLCRYERYGEYDLLMECWHERLANPDGPEAADEIERLRAEVERLRGKKERMEALMDTTIASYEKYLSAVSGFIDATKPTERSK